MVYLREAKTTVTWPMWVRGASLLSSMTLSGMGPSMALEDSTTAAVFEAHVERVLAPSLCPGQVVVMDNLSAHKPKG